MVHYSASQWKPSTGKLSAVCLCWCVWYHVDMLVVAYSRGYMSLAKSKVRSEPLICLQLAAQQQPPLRKGSTCLSVRAVLIAFNVIWFPAPNPGLKASEDLQLLLGLWAFAVSFALTHNSCILYQCANSPKHFANPCMASSSWLLQGHISLNVYLWMLTCLRL